MAAALEQEQQEQEEEQEQEELLAEEGVVRSDEQRLWLVELSDDDEDQEQEEDEEDEEEQSKKVLVLEMSDDETESDDEPDHSQPQDQQADDEQQQEAHTPVGTPQRARVVTAEEEVQSNAAEFKAALTGVAATDDAAEAAEARGTPTSLDFSPSVTPPKEPRWGLEVAEPGSGTGAGVGVGSPAKQPWGAPPPKPSEGGGGGPGVRASAGQMLSLLAPSATLEPPTLFAKPTGEPEPEPTDTRQPVARAVPALRPTVATDGAAEEGTPPCDSAILGGSLPHLFRRPSRCDPLAPSSGAKAARNGRRSPSPVARGVRDGAVSPEGVPPARAAAAVEEEGRGAGGSSLLPLFARRLGEAMDLD